MAPAPGELRELLGVTTAAARDEAWARFVNRFTPLLLHTARVICRETDRTMDAYAFVLEQLRQDEYRRLRRYTENPSSQFTTWLVVVTRRLCHDFLRQRYGRVRNNPDVSPEEHIKRRRLADLITGELDASMALADPAEPPDASLGRRDQAAVLETILTELPAEQRLLLTLRFERDLTAREIAGLLGFPTVFHVYRAINAVLATLRESLRRKGIHDAEP